MLTYKNGIDLLGTIQGQALNSKGMYPRIGLKVI
jgi:hypothetical protein